MAKFLPLAVLAAALAGCSSNPPQPPTRNIVTYVHPYQAGTGVVQSISASAAGMDASSAEPMARLEIKMDNGRVQYVDTPSRDFTRGTRVQLTEDRLIKRI
jgi:hypothetical protein